MTKKKYKYKLENDIKSVLLTITEVQREAYIKHAIDILLNYHDNVPPKDIALAIKELFHIGTIDPSVLEGHPTFAVEGTARALYEIGKARGNVLEIINELKNIESTLMEDIVIELKDYKEGLKDGLGI